MDKFNSIKRASIFGVIGNIFLLIIKLLIGLVTNSQAMIGDALNSAGDIFASLMTFIGNKIASAPGDENHNFGHGKAEYIFSLFIAISMIFVSFFDNSFATYSLIGNNLIEGFGLSILSILIIL